MKIHSDLEYLKLSKGQKFLYKIMRFFGAIPQKLIGLFAALWNLIRKGACLVKDEAVDIFTTFIHGVLPGHGLWQSGPGPGAAGIAVFAV